MWLDIYQAGYWIGFVHLLEVQNIHSLPIRTLKLSKLFPSDSSKRLSNCHGSVSLKKVPFIFVRGGLYYASSGRNKALH